jgi:hypothetical protein
LIRFAKGGEAVIIAFDADDRVILSSTASSPPGSVIDATLNGTESIRIKVRGCKRDEERFRIEGRILDVSRQLRERLSALVTRP